VPDPVDIRRDAATASPPALMRRAAACPPAPLAAAGALCIAGAPVLVALADSSPGTVAFFRFLLALPLLAALALGEARAAGARDRGAQRAALLSGPLLAADMLLWNQAIADSGAGIATVVVNAQVVLMPLLAWLATGERPHRRFALAVPLMLAGVALAGGIGDPAAFGPDPARGTVLAAAAALCYAGFLFLLRRSGDAQPRVVAPVWEATLTATVASLALGLAWRGIDVTPTAETLGWLVALALGGQVAGWLLIGAALPRLSASAGASLLLLQPIGAVGLAALALGERPSALQLAGCAIVLGAVALATIGAPPPPTGRRVRRRGGAAAPGPAHA
jgi:drug/metabolite transporter (DMT)-like permease